MKRLGISLLCVGMLVSGSQLHGMNGDSFGNKKDINVKKYIVPSMKIVAGLGIFYCSRKLWRSASKPIGFGESAEGTNMTLAGSFIDAFFGSAPLALAGIGILSGGSLAVSGSYKIYEIIKNDSAAIGVKEAK